MEKTSKLKKFIINNKNAFISSGVMLIIMLIIFAINENFPFGKNSVASYDLNSQIIPLSQLLLDIVKGEGGIFYSIKVAKGMPVFVTLLYFLMSPLYVIILICGRTNVYYAVNILLIVNLMAVAFSMSYALKKLFPNLNNAVSILLSLCYCLGGYVVLNYTYIIWLNFMILLPIMAVAFKRMIDIKKYKLFSFLTFLYIISCFGVGSMSQFVFLFIFYLYIMINVEKEDRKEHLVRLTVAMFVAVAFSMLFILPPFLESFSSARTDGVGLSYLFQSDFKQEINNKLAFVLVDGSLLLLSILFIILADKKDKMNRFLSIALILSYLILFIDEAVLILNFGKYLSYSTRSSSLCSLLIVFCSAKLVVEKFATITNKAKQNPCLFIVLSVVVGLVVTCIVLFKINKLGYYLSVNKTRSEDLKYGLAFVAISAFLLTAIMIFFKINKLSRRWANISICLLLSVQLVFGCMVMYGNSHDRQNYLNGYEMCQSLDNYDVVKSLNTVNSSIYYGNSSISVFSSFIPAKNANALASLGYYTSNNNIKVSGGTLFSDSFLGVKYVLSNQVLNESYYNLIKSSLNINTNSNNVEKQYLYEYKFGTTGNFISSEYFAWEEGEDAFTNQNNLAKTIGAKTDIFQCFTLSDVLKGKVEEVAVKKTGINRVSENEFTIAKNGGQVIIDHLNSSSSILYFVIDNELVESLENAVYKEFPESYIYKSSSNIFNFKACDKLDMSKMYFGLLDLDNFEQEMNNIKENQVELNYTKYGFKLNLSVEQGTKLISSTINSKGLNAENNKKTVKISDYGKGFIEIDLKQGGNKISVWYFYPYLIPTITISIILIALAIVVIKLYDKKGRFIFLEKYIGGIYLAYAVIFVAVLFIFVAVVGIVKLIV